MADSETTATWGMFPPEQWQHTDTSAYVERPLTAEIWQELRGEEADRG